MLKPSQPWKALIKIVLNILLSQFLKTFRLKKSHSQLKWRYNETSPHPRGWCHLSPQRKGSTFLCENPGWHHLLITGHLALPLQFPAEGVLSLCKCHFGAQSSLTLFVCWIPLPREGGPRGEGRVRGEGCAQLARRPLFTQLPQKVLYALQQPRRRPPRLNSASGQCSQHSILGTV